MLLVENIDPFCYSTSLALTDKENFRCLKHLAYEIKRTHFQNCLYFIYLTVSGSFQASHQSVSAAMTMLFLPAKEKKKIHIKSVGLVSTSGSSC